MNRLVRIGSIAVAAGALLCTLASGWSIPPAAAQATSPDPADMRALVDAVNKEGGTLNVAWSNAVYGGADGAKLFETAINEKYHTHLSIKFLPLSIPGFAFSNQVEQEVAAGQTASSDILFDLHRSSEGPSFYEVDYRKYVPGLPEDAMWFGKRAVAVASYLGGFYYNTKLVPANMVPHSLYDLLKPEWKGKIATPQIEGAQANFLTLPSGLGGDATLKFFGDFAKQVGGLIRCGTSDRVASGEFWIFGYDCGDGEARLAQRKGQPLAEFYPKEGTSLNYYAPGIPRTAAHPMAARLLIAYMLTRPGQEMLWNIMGLDYHKLPGSHVAAIIAEQRRKGTKIIEAYGLDATHPELDRYEKQIGDLVAQAH